MNLKSKSVVDKFFIAFSLSIVSATAYANGFTVNMQSASGSGTGMAGRASTPIDATILYGNPAGLVRLDRAQISTGFGYVKANLDISDASAQSTYGRSIWGTNDGDSVPNLYIPFAFASMPMTDRLTLGLGVYAPFGLSNSYEPSFMGRYHGVFSKVSVITVQPTMSLKVTDALSIGFGPTFNRISGRLKNNIDMTALGGRDGMIDIKGSDAGAIGFNFGVMYDPFSGTTLGLTYHSRVNYKLTGRTWFSGLSGPMAAVNGRYDAELKITLPEMVDFSVTQKLSDRWTLYGGAAWTRWSRFKALDIDNSNMPVASFKRLHETFNWGNTWSLSVGASYQLNPQLVLRAGFTHDASPTNNETRNVRIPVADRQYFALGVGWMPTTDWTFDFSYTYLHEKEALINQPVKNALVPSYSGRFKNSAHELVFQLTRRF